MRQRRVWGRSQAEADWHSVHVKPGPHCVCSAWEDGECACGALSIPDTAGPICGATGFGLGNGSAALSIDTSATFGPVCAACARLEGL